jgi:hypothetical protein
MEQGRQLFYTTLYNVSASDYTFDRNSKVFFLSFILLYVLLSGRRVYVPYTILYTHFVQLQLRFSLRFLHISNISVAVYNYCLPILPPKSHKTKM